MLAIVQLSDVFPDIGAPDAGMTLDTHVVAQCQHHLLYLSGQLPRGREHKGLCFPQLDVDFLEDSDRKRSRLSGSRLSSVCHQKDMQEASGGGYNRSALETLLCNDVSSLNDWNNCSLLNC